MILFIVLCNMLPVAEKCTKVVNCNVVNCNMCMTNYTHTHINFLFANFTSIIGDSKTNFFKCLCKVNFIIKIIIIIIIIIYYYLFSFANSY